MAQTLRLRVITPERVLLSVDEAAKVRLRLADRAWLSVYPYHAPLVAETLPGVLQYETETEAGEMRLGAGILRILGNEVTVLTRGQLGRTRETELTEEDRRYDRLMRQLMSSLGAQSTEDGAAAERD